jgi:hypothetical protein
MLAHSMAQEPEMTASESLEFELEYSAAGVEVREDLRDTHRALLDALRRPGAWLTGTERIAVAEESRNATACGLCRKRKQALSPEQVQGDHDAVTDLPSSWVEVVHRVRADSGRLSKRFFEKAIESGLSVEHYVEIVGIVTLLAGADHFCRAIDIPLFDLPAPVDGEPNGHRPDGMREGIAWVPMLMPEDASGAEAELYPKDTHIPNIARALSLVPDHARMLQRWTASHYVRIEDIPNPAVGRDLDRLQIELVAARVSALNECFY